MLEDSVPVDWAMADRVEKAGSWGNWRVTSVETKLRNMVSKEKRRFKDEKYDLDLTYINDKIIAMGFPSSGSEATYRNDADDVYNFFEERHKDHYKFYNLCSERAYPAERFHGRVAHFPFDDHNPPPLGMFLYFCKDVEEWLAQDPLNVAAIHCKAGKGRTGVMITAFLMYNKDWEVPEDAMAFYGFARTNNQKGITIPSQRTFIYYWHKILTDTDQYDKSGDRRNSMFSSDADGAAKVKAQIKAAASEHLKEGGEEDDSDSDHEGLDPSEVGSDAPPPAPGSEEVDASVGEQIAQLEALLEAGHLSSAEFDEAKKHVLTSAGMDPDTGLRASASAAAGAGGGGSRQVASPPPTPGSGGGGGGGGAAAAEESPDNSEEEEDDDDAKKGKAGGMSSMFGKMGFGKKKGLTKTASVAAPKMIDPLMDRSWNDRNRSEPPTRGQIPAPVLKVITGLRIHTTPKGGFEPFFCISSGGLQYESKDMCIGEVYDKQSVIDIAVPDLAVVDECFFVQYKAGGVLGKKKKMFQFWFHTSFVEGDSLVVKKGDMDKAIKDKKHKKYDANFKIEFLFKPQGPALTNASDPRRPFVPRKCELK